MTIQLKEHKGTINQQKEHMRNQLRNHHHFYDTYLKRLDSIGPLFRRLLILSLSLVFSGCMVGSNYKAPKNDVSDKWQEKDANRDSLFSKNAPLEEWWKAFEDQLLDKYISLAFKYNKDILTTEANILQARALRQVAASKLFPYINADVNAGRQRFSKNGLLLGIAPSGSASSINLFNALFDASWEIDLFGKTRRQVEAATAQVSSMIETRNDMLISVTAEVARNYMEVRSYQKKADLIEENIRLLEENAAVIQQSVDDGYKNQLNLENIKAELAAARSQLPDAVAKIYRGIYALSFLIGEVPEALLNEMLKPQKTLPKLPYEVAIGVRSDLLRRRPDIRRAERELAAATADIGVAVASFFPTFTLSADLGLQALKIAQLFRAASKTWELGGDMNAPIFEGGRLMGNWKASKAAASATMYTYQKIVLNALQEAEGSLVSYREDLKALKDLKEKAQRNQRLVALTTERHDKGLVDVIELINSRRELVSAEESVLGSNTTTLLDLISLYKALGGGWEAFKPLADF